ncbi:MAG: heavy-metal-associated domain-containing protein [Verrucomicrobiota bacterium]
MKALKRTAPILALLTSAWLLPADPQGKPVANATNEFKIAGMHCQGCASGVQSELRRLPGVLQARVTLSNELAVVIFDTNRMSPRKLTRAIDEAGYKASPLDRESAKGR